MYDLIIIGGGPAALSAGIYAARKKIKLLLITKTFGGAIFESYYVENYLGVEGLPGTKLTEKFVNHLKKFDLEIKTGETVARIEKLDSQSDYFKVTADKNSYEAKSLIVATGSQARELNIPGAKEFTGKGVSYCATCDAPLFNDKIVAVVGAGDAGLDAAWQLTAYAKKIYILNKYPELKSDDIILQEKIKTHPKIEIISSAQAKEIKGTKFVENLVYKKDDSTRLVPEAEQAGSPQDGEKKEIKVDGIFVEIGSIPASIFVKDLVKLNEKGEIIIDLKTNKASIRGIFAAGDVTDMPHKQIVVAAGEGAKAALSVYEYLKSL